MRRDMARVIVERPRIRTRNERQGRACRPDDLPQRESIRRPHVLRRSEKSLNENLAPLRRYLERQVGRPWDNVYSEIAANLRVDNTVQQHLRDDIGDFVALGEPPRAIIWRRPG